MYARTIGPMTRRKMRLVVGAALLLLSLATLIAPRPAHASTTTSAAPTMATSPGAYALSGNTGATYPLLSKNNFVNGADDDQLFFLSTGATGKHKLPFAIDFYNQSYKNIAISTNGNIQIGATLASAVTSAPTNDCLPTTVFSKPMIMPFWDDLFFDSNDASHGFTEGIFPEVSGTAPHRTFAINWQGQRLAEPGALVLARVVFKEGSQKIRFVYGTSGGGSATVGVQSANQATSTQWACNTGTTTAVQSGLKLTFTHFG